jgi:hypothetical protein
VKAALLAGALAAAPLVTTALPATPAAAATAQAKVVIVAIPDLRWADLEVMPRLTAWASTAAAGELSTKTSTGTPRCSDGSLTFAAGDRANADRAFEPCAMTPAGFVAMRAVNLASKFSADPGAFGQALVGAGVSRAAVGLEASALLADNRGHVPQATDLRAAVDSADVVAILDNEMYDAPAVIRPAAAASLDRILAQQLAQIPASTTVMVAGTSDGAVTRMHLHVLLIRGPGWRHVALRSPSTRLPYVQLRDLAPTVLSLLHVPIPSVMVGRPAYQTNAAVKSALHYADDDDHAVTAREVGQGVRAVFAYAAIVVLGLLLLAHRRRTVGRAAVVLGTIAVGAPACSFLVQVLPWWRWNSWIYGLLVAAGGVVVGLACVLARRRNTALALIVGPAFTAVVLLVDQLTGAHLQLSAPLGDNPIVAGRFHGMGNTDFALMCTSVVLCAAVAAGALRRAGRQRVALAVAAGLCLVAIVIDAAPTIGDDFGGLLAMGPTAVLLVALLAGMRLTWWRVIAAVVVAAVVAVGVALIDYARPADRQTHVGRFVGEVLHGGASDTLHRKFDASIASFKNVALSCLVVVVIVVVVVARRRVAETLRRVDGLTEAAVALVVLAVLGTFLNDSGVVVGGTVLLLTLFATAASGLMKTGNDGTGGSPP